MNFQHDITTFVALFAIMNPIGAIPLFLAITPADKRIRQKIALQAGLATVITLVIAYFVGDSILALG